MKLSEGKIKNFGEKKALKIYIKVIDLGLIYVGMAKKFGNVDLHKDSSILFGCLLMYLIHRFFRLIDGNHN